MKILHYIPSVDETSGGVGAYMQLIARDLGKLCDLHIITHKGVNDRILENCTIHYMPYKWKPWDNCKAEFVALLNDIKPDVFHTNCCWMPLSAITAMWAKKLGYKVIYTPHGMLEPYAIKRHYWTKKLPAIILFQKRGLKVCDMIHATADTEKQNLLKLGWNNNIKVVANCVQIDEIEIKKSWQKNKTILFLSRVHPKKGINFLIEAVSQLRSELFGYKIIIAGPGEADYVQELKRMADKYGVLHMFDFVGPIYANDKWPMYRNADVFVLPTLSENFGIVVPEALASGTPVITTFGTPWAELNDNNCGWCVNVGTEPLVNALRQFLSCSEAHLECMGKRGRQLVEDKYSSASVAKQFVEMYQSIIVR